MEGFPMRKIDIENLKRLKKKEERARQRWLDVGKEYMAALDTGHKDELGMPFHSFCDWCGRVAPKCGYIPIFAHGPESHSGLICIDCDTAWRKKHERESKSSIRKV
jgi:hypothetical protein